MKQLLDDEIRYDGSRSAALLEMLREFVRNSCAGRRCPSHWQLAGKYNVSRSTVEKVYQQLAIEGLVEQRRGSGTFVAGRRV
ncbi:MAG: GntR family transcriptional regulator, partial [Lentisphaeria bacterium]|nr:GntR family transcriptional regulator [Lentisphaeria bacterium]